jgi:hypothetical protein
MSIQPGVSTGTLDRSRESGLADVVGTILDKGVVVDIFARVSLVGIEILRVDARVVIASVDTYLRFAQAVNRVELGAEEPSGLPEVIEQTTEAGTKGIAKGKTKGLLEAGAETIMDAIQQARSEAKEKRS